MRNRLTRCSGLVLTAVWLPPVTKGASATFSIGYDVFDDYDLGSKKQKGTVATRYGSREQLARRIAMMRRKNRNTRDQQALVTRG